MQNLLIRLTLSAIKMIKQLVNHYYELLYNIRLFESLQRSVVMVINNNIIHNFVLKNSNIVIKKRDIITINICR